MSSDLPRSARWMIGNHALRLLIGFFLGSWVARVLGPSQFGVLATATAVGSIAYSLVELGVRQLLLKELGRRRLLGPVIAGTVFKFWLVSGVFATGILCLWNAGTHTLPWSVLAATAMPLLLMGVSVHNNWEESCGRAFVSARNAMAGYLSAAGARLIAVVLLPTLPVIAWTIAMESVVVSLLGLWTGKKRGRGFWLAGWNRRVASSILSRGGVLFISQAGSLLLLRVDTMMIEHISGATETGIYGAAVRLSELAYALSPILVTLLLPRLAKLKTVDRQAAFHDATGLGFSIAALLGYASAVGLWLVGGLIIQGLFGTVYQPSIPVLMIHCLAAVPFFLGEWRHAVLVALDRPRLTAFFSWLALALNVSLNLLWIPSYGAQGAAWATLVSYSLGALVATWFVADLRWIARLQGAALLEPLRWCWQPKRRWLHLKSVLAVLS
ncbi:Membrane protein involved in the export of O-antigen and teichoic acid [Prosthecobacter debontii]|uniref:Membrane protein involved in the export of O-antigen and teichoic acid n=1 Tax=Prosthecobacter debontii TaxID=48467 RepID=A0A1T4YVN4_9BACT|nr:flippase [Prosthecobacter debontii]SKB05822.1 Membrane protein involved in the export of O-antigen and teichoic acid [Prosthecobacter debontii]